MTDSYANRADSISAPARRGFAITPSDAADLAVETRAIYVGTSGDIALTLGAGDDVLFAGVLGGTILPVRARRVKATGTSAAQLVGLY